MQLLQWADNLINDGTRFQSFLTSPAIGNANTTTNRANRDGAFSSAESVNRLPRQLIVEIFNLDSNAAAARLDLRHYFETESGETKLLTGINDIGETVGVECKCIGFIEFNNSANNYQAVLETQSDPYWRRFTDDSVITNITTSGQQFTIDVDCDQIVRPSFLFTPRTAKTNDNAFKQFVAVRWNGRQGVEEQVDIADAGLDTRIATTNFASATGDDIRLVLNGVFHDLWFHNINTANTEIWTYLDFAETIPLTIRGTLPASGTIASIDFNEDITRLPTTGIILIDTEIFLFNGKNDTIRRIFIESRAAKNTAEAAHGDGATADWIQHDLEIQYGDSSLSAYPSNPAKEPLIDRATSTNLQHNYLTFGDRLATRPGNWAKSAGVPQRQGWQATPYSETEYPGFAAADPLPSDPFNVLGAYIQRGLVGVDTDILWEFESSKDITNVQFLDGKKRKSLQTSVDDSWRGRGIIGYDRIGGTGTLILHSEALPLSNDSFQTWSHSNSLPTLVNKLYFGHVLTGVPSSLNNSFFEIGRVVLDFDNTQTPKPFLAPEAGNYSLLGSLTHIELNKRIDLAYTFGLNQTLEFNTDEGKITDLTDNSDQFQALINVVPPSTNFLPLIKGTNTLQWDELDIQSMDLEVRYKKRYGA